MIDYVAMHTHSPIPIELLRTDMWRKFVSTADETLFYYNKNSVTLTYYPYRAEPSLHLKGKLITLLHNSQVNNLDDVYGADVERFIDEFNEQLNTLFTEPLLDIRSFNVTRIDYCFNIKTPHVTQYIEFFNKAFTFTESTTRINYTTETQKYGSCYVKTASDYKQNTRKNYVINFYDKSDWIIKRRAKGIPIPRTEDRLAKDVLRLEIQCGGDLLRNVCTEMGCPRTFEYLCNFDVALHVFDKVYKTVFHGTSAENFYSYNAADEILSNNTKQKRGAGKDKGKSVPQKALLRLSQNHPIAGADYQYARDFIKSFGIYPYRLIPTSWGIDSLDNPITLIHKKIASLSLDSTPE